MHWQTVSYLVILGMGFIAADIGRTKKPYKTKCVHSFILATLFFIIASILLKKIKWPLYLMLIGGALFLVSSMHFINNYAETYGNRSISSFLKKRTRETEVNNDNKE
ncbi:hypothetical protein [Cardiobacterium valvarum]|uniref:hypothetical protein n=1 Tax=Cardiobacterium valvarum TaxID=194702 RepID=UPI0011C02A15|nr:hypothetical protein [Cardiobacterium valvarum]